MPRSGQKHLGRRPILGVDPIPSGPYLTVPAARAYVVWVFQSRSLRTSDAALHARLELAARVLAATPFRTALDVWEAAIKEAIRLMFPPLTGPLCHSFNALAERGDGQGWLKTPLLEPFPALRYWRTRIALFCALSGPQASNPDLFQTPALALPLLGVARFLMEGQSWSSELPDQHALVASLCDQTLRALPLAQVPHTAGFVENIRAMALGSRPRTWAELLRAFGVEVVKGAGTVARTGAEAAGTVIQNVREGLDQTADGLGTTLLVGLGVGALVLGTAFVVVRGR